MNASKDKYRKHIKITVVMIKIICIIVVALILGRYYMCTHQEYNDYREKDTYLSLANDTKYELCFVNGVSEVSQISYVIRGCQNSTGTINLYMKDANGNYVIPYNQYRVEDFAIYGNEVVFTTPTIMPTEIGKMYTITLWIEGANEDDSFEIKCASSGRMLSFAKYNNKLTLQKMLVTFTGNHYFGKDRIFIVTVFLLSIGMMLFLRFNICIKHQWLKEILWLSASGYVFLIEELASDHIYTMTIENIGIGIFVVYILIRFLVLLADERKIALILSGTIFCVVGTIEYYVLEFRGTPVVPWDMRAVRTALTVVGGYKFDFPFHLVLAWMLLLGLILLLNHIEVERGHKHFWIRKGIELLGIGAGLVLFGGVLYPKLDANLWDLKTTYQKQGTFTSIISYARYIQYNKPDGYSSDECRKLLDSVDVVKNETSVIQAQNIIVIMNESFSDLRVINESMIPEDNMQYIDSLTEDVIKGNLYVPVYGGGTCNSEFEVLTGVSTRYTPANPYVTCMNRNVNSLVSKMNANEYSTYAFHPYIITNWNRNQVYPYMGFEQIKCIDDMLEPRLLRWCVSDGSDYEELERWNRENDTDKFFMFNVTMQNHGEYGAELQDFDVTVDLSEYGNYPEAEEYLSLMKVTDATFRDLIEYYEKQDEPTLICMFGDHQGTIETKFYEQMYGKSMGELSDDEKMKMYITPFIIWTNYDIEVQTVDKMSSNYLSTLILQAAGYDLDGYEAFLYNVYQKYPVVSVNGIYDANGRFYKSEDEIDDPLLLQYQYLQYYRMHGGR